MKTPLLDRCFPVRVAGLAVFAGLISISAWAAQPAQPRVQVDSTSAAAPRELAPLDVMLFVHRADLAPVGRLAPLTGARHGERQ